MITSRIGDVCMPFVVRDLWFCGEVKGMHVRLFLHVASDLSHGHGGILRSGRRGRRSNVILERRFRLERREECRICS